MGILFAILLFFHVVVCLFLVLIVMMQRPKQEGLGAAFASGMMHDSFGAQTTDVLQKGTRVLAIAFFVLSISLAVIKAQENQNLRSAAGARPGLETPAVAEEPGALGTGEAVEMPPAETGEKGTGEKPAAEGEAAPPAAAKEGPGESAVSPEPAPGAGNARPGGGEATSGPVEAEGGKPQ